MREPRFWSRDVDPKSREAAPLLRFLLTPFSWLYAAVTRRRLRTATAHEVSAKVICIGNLTAGGVGKSPVVLALRTMIEARPGLRVATLSRGYKGKLKGPLRVDPSVHSAADVGDEPLMLALTGEAWIGADRAKAGETMNADGVDVILMDDGHQNPGLKKDLTFIVVDAKAGFGNGFVIPKGPLREPVRDGLLRADAIILLGEPDRSEDLAAQGLPVITGRIVARETPPHRPYVAFAGIGRPEKFFETLAGLSVDVRDAVPFPDHHTFTEGDMRYLRRLAEDHEAGLITTEKDFARLPDAWREGLVTLPIDVRFDRREALDKMLEDMIKPPANG